MNKFIWVLLVMLGLIILGIVIVLSMNRCYTAMAETIKKGDEAQAIEENAFRHEHKKYSHNLVLVKDLYQHQVDE